MEANTAIREAVEEDYPWVKRIFNASEHILGRGFFGTIWYRYWKYRTERERWIVIEGKAFAHFKTRKADGVRVLYEIAVAPEEQRKGYGKSLVEFIGLPMELKTDHDHTQSNLFYKALGFYPAGVKVSRDGKKRLRIYHKCAR